MPHVDPTFRRRLGRAIRLYCRELRDGCNECRAARGYCHEHLKVAVDVALNPRKYITLTPRSSP